MSVLIIEPSLDATISVADPEQNLDASEGTVGATGQYRLILGYQVPSGAYTSAKLRFRILYSVPDGALPTSLCLMPLTAGIPIDETQVNAESPDGSAYEWPDGFAITDGAKSPVPGMSGHTTPLATFSWPDYPETAIDVDLDITSVITNYPLAQPALRTLMLFSSNEVSSKAELWTGQKDFEDGYAVQLVLTPAVVGGRGRSRRRYRGNSFG